VEAFLLQLRILASSGSECLSLGRVLLFFLESTLRLKEKQSFNALQGRRQ